MKHTNYLLFLVLSIAAFGIVACSDEPSEKVSSEQVDTTGLQTTIEERSAINLKSGDLDGSWILVWVKDEWDSPTSIVKESKSPALKVTQFYNLGWIVGSEILVRGETAYYELDYAIISPSLTKALKRFGGFASELREASNNQTGSNTFKQDVGLYRDSLRLSYSGSTIECRSMDDILDQRLTIQRLDSNSFEFKTSMILKGDDTVRKASGKFRRID